MKQGIQTNFPHEKLREYGCYFFVLLRWAEILRGGSFEFADTDALRIFDCCKKFGWVEDDCFVINPVAVLNYCQKQKVFISVSKSLTGPGEGICAVYLKKPKHGHFVLSRKGEIWDSLDPGRPGAKDYRVDSYRVII